MFSCDYGDAVEDAYFVFLHHGCSLEKHSQTVREQVGLDLKFSHILAETAGHGLTYTAEDVDAVALESIRADVAVDLVGCNRAVEIDLEWEDYEIIEPKES